MMCHSHFIMITVNQYFPDISSVANYLAALEGVTTHPTEDAIAELKVADEKLTSRAVLFPCQEFVHDEGYRTFGFKPCTISDSVENLARLALHEPGSPEYENEYAQVWSGPVRRDAATGEKRRNAARVALIGLGGKLAVSGALIVHNIEPAYGAICESMATIGEHDQEFTAFGMRRIRKDLFTQYARLGTTRSYQNPIGNKEAKTNIRAAWNVVGRPYGIFTRAIAALS